jgi:hypothetical protein
MPTFKRKGLRITLFFQAQEDQEGEFFLLPQINKRGNLQI